MPQAKDPDLRRIEAKIDAVAFMFGGPLKQWIIEIDRTGQAAEAIKQRKRSTARQLKKTP